jgi:hypothetical protein
MASLRHRMAGRRHSLPHHMTRRDNGAAGGIAAIALLFCRNWRALAASGARVYDHFVKFFAG